MHITVIRVENSLVLSKYWFLFTGANTSGNISLDSSILNIDNTTIYEEDNDNESVLASSFANVSIGLSYYGDDLESVKALQLP